MENSLINRGLTRVTKTVLGTLRGRYALISIVTAAAILVSTIAGNFSVFSVRETSSFNLIHRPAILEKSRRVRDFIWQAQRHIEEFLRDPAQDARRGLVHVALAKAYNTVGELRLNPWVVQNQNAFLLSRLQALIQDLIDRSEALMQLRTDPIQQYPGFAIATRQLYDVNQAFFSSADLALKEMESEGLNQKNSKSYQEFTAARHAWSQLTSSFRMYLANRMGSFDDRAQKNQQYDTELFFENAVTHLNELQRLDKLGGLEFQGSESMRAMKTAARAWKNYYEAVLKINSSDHWRTDTKYMEDHVSPLFNDIWSLMLSSDVFLEKMSEGDVDTIAGLAFDQSKILWVMAAIGILFLGGGFWFLDKSVLRPMANVAGALKAEAEGKLGATLPDVHIKETDDLMDAFREMQKQVRERQEKLEYLALHDSLTGLPNRVLFLDRLNQAIVRAQREFLTPAILLLDLDRFKEINDTLGHQVGDAFLQEFGRRLQRGLRKSDTVARLGGDEFAVLINHSSMEQAKTVAEKIHFILKDPFEFQQKSFFTSASIGIAHFPEHGEDVTSLMQRGDIAMYVSKRNQQKYAVYSFEEDQLTQHYLSLFADLKVAIEKDALELYYQPQIDYSNNAIIGAEALLRWNHHNLGSISPDRIVTLAEERGLMGPLTDWVTDHAVAQAAEWHALGANLRVSINLSALNLQQTDFVSGIEAVISKYQFVPGRLLLELTEGAMMSNPALAGEQLKKLADQGVYCAVDDFGIGFSSLSYIKKLPIRELKIDKSFVLNLTRDVNDNMIVRSTIELAHNLGLKVVAEGVETLAVDERLRAMGCDYAQGYFYGKPMPAKQFFEFVKKHSSAIWRPDNNQALE